MRVRLVRPLLAEIAQLDTLATAQAPGYDPDFQEPRAGTRQEKPPIRVPAQVEITAHEVLQQSMAGNVFAARQNRPGSARENGSRLRIRISRSALEGARWRGRTWASVWARRSRAACRPRAARLSPLAGMPQHPRVIVAGQVCGEGSRLAQRRPQPRPLGLDACPHTWHARAASGSTPKAPIECRGPAQPCGSRREGPSIRTVWQRWRRRLSRASTRALLPRKLAHSG